MKGTVYINCTCIASKGTFPVFHQLILKMVKQIVIKSWSGVGEVYDPVFYEYEIYSESVITFVVIQVSNTTSLGVYFDGNAIHQMRLNYGIKQEAKQFTYDQVILVDIEEHRDNVDKSTLIILVTSDQTN